MLRSFKSKKASSVISKVSEWCYGNKGYEVCGFIGEDDDEYCCVMCENKAENPRNEFLIDPIDYLHFTKNKKEIFLFHSHILGDENPSEKDIVMSENSCLPFLIYSLNTKKFFTYIPKKTKVDVSIINKFKKHYDEN